MRLLTLIENAEEGVSVRLDDSGLVLLQRHNQYWKSTLGLSREPFSYRDGALFARDVIGFVNLGSLSVEVAPKFLTKATVTDPQWRRALWAILCRVCRVPGYYLSTPARLEAGSVPDMLGVILLASLRDGSLNGRPKGYTAERDRLVYFRGRLDMVNVLDLLMYPGQIPCEYDVFSENVPTNRLLRWSAEQLAGQVHSVPLALELQQEAQSFKEVSSVPPTVAEAERIVLPPYHVSLRPAVLVGQLLLRGLGMQHGVGEYELPGFLLKSHLVFERFVLYLLRMVIRSHFAELKMTRGLVTLSEPSVSNGRRLGTNPDVRLVRRQRTVGVLDAKYKSIDFQPLESDTYQVVTGAWLTDASVAALIYPGPGGNCRRPVGWRLLGPSNPEYLWIMFINVIEMGSQSGERVLIDQLKMDLRRILVD